MVGDHVQAAELAEQYDAVIYAVGAQSDKPLNIPGEDLPGSVAAVDFVGWYNAHPHFEESTPDLSGARAVVVGNGNVAIDVARILVTDPDVLAATDIADHALESLRPCGVEEVVIIGRRGPLQTAFTTLELRELGELEGSTSLSTRRSWKASLTRMRPRPARPPRPTSRCCVTMPSELPGPTIAASCSGFHLPDRDQGRGPGRKDRAGAQRIGD